MPSSGTRNEIENALVGAVAQGVDFAAARGMVLSGIGLAIPGPFDYVAGIPRMTHKFRAIYGVNLRDLLHAQPNVGSDVSIVFMQDVNAALAGEISRGNATGSRSAALITLGTGLGFALSRGDKVLSNAAGGPAEVIFNRPYRDGILEDYASKRGFLRIYSEFAENTDDSLTVADLGHMADAGDPLARKTFATVGNILATSLHDLLEQYEIECLLLGGQISRSFRWIESALQEGLRDLPKVTRIDAAAHIDKAAFYGILTQFDRLL